VLVLARTSRAVAILGVLAAALIGVAYAADLATEQRLAHLDSRLTRLEGVLGNKVLLDMLQRIESLQRELQAVQDASDRTAHELEGIKARQRELYLDVGRRLRALETAKAASLANGQTPPPAPPLAPLSKAPTPLAAQAAETVPPEPATPAAGDADRVAYERAFNLLKEGHYRESIAALNQFLTRYPQSIYAGNAQYWLAEANYVSGDYPRAAKEFSQVAEQYPDSSKVPDSKLKLGFTHYELEQWNEARVVLTDLTKQYPNTAVAQLAENRLQRMDREGH
jgi:tol-pal system protein YbgF